MNQINFPIDPKTLEGLAAIRFLLTEKITTPEMIYYAVDGLDLVENCIAVEDSPWIADDGNAPVEYDSTEYTAREAAEEYVRTGDWGDDLDGSINVSVWRDAIDEDGDDCRVDEDTFDIDLVDVMDHDSAIHAAMGDAGCGDDPDDHDWTSEGEGGLDENPGVWSTGGTSMTFKSHCRKCGLHRTEHHTGSQRNPGQGDSVEYRSLDEDEIEWHRQNGSMDMAE